MGSLAYLETDSAAFTISALIVAAYYGFLNYKVRNNPTYTIHGVNALARSLWVEHIMRNASKDVMAVQTLRNWIMGASLMASTAALLIIGTLTLSGQTENISQSWHVLSVRQSIATELWILKVMLLLLDFIVAFFAFTMSVRLANHVVFMVNVPNQDAHHILSPKAVARRMQRAGRMFTIGMRAFFFAVPLVFWLFGPYFLLASSIGLVITLYHLDRTEPEEALEGATRKAAPTVVPIQAAKYAE
ncbi:MAG: DUF599 domain-containing protein [Thiobacillus sp.]|jgi:uncharacterized membrane protein|uniref:DUF599 domain-containing protein n=1 Tax=Thiobacillus sp. TaxID=924 RepID=UPI0028957230|nr:DUF599 domain-containing protein [Thiobacillus sp.]MDT3708352.1 DUF599 domain-containing protein [Thiobacillus sp.]